MCTVPMFWKLALLTSDQWIRGQYRVEMNFVSRIFQIVFQLNVIVTVSLATTKQKTNILFFYVDDLGWNDVGFHGMTDIPTPNIDALAYNGIILNSYYTYPLCTPSRTSLISSRLSTSIGLQHLVLQSGQPLGLPLDLKTLPQYLNDLGYESHMVGKWHLGSYTKAHTPTLRGFESHYGIWNGLADHFSHVSVQDYPRSFVRGAPPSDTSPNITIGGVDLHDGFKVVNRPGEYLADLFTNRSVDIIRHHDKRKPLFLYLSHHGVHRGNFLKPIRGPQRYVKLFTNLEDDPRRRKFAGALTAIDRSLGDIVEALEQSDMLEDTLIIFASDNGAPMPGTFSDNGGSNYPLTGGKQTTWEGGVRGNAFLWSGHLKKRNFVYKGLMHVVDWIPTLYAAAGGKHSIEKIHKLDGKNLWWAITENTTSPRESILLQSDDNVMAYRRGNFKIMSGDAVPLVPDHCTRRGPPPPGLTEEVSKTLLALKRTIGHSVRITGKPVEVECGEPSLEKCEPAMKPCLFDIEEDPCEIRNLAESQPTTLRILENEMKSQTVAEYEYPDVDYNSNPDFYCGYWVPWLDDPKCPNITTY